MNKVVIRATAAAVVGVFYVSLAVDPVGADHGPDSMYPTSETGSCVDGTIGDPFCRTDNSFLTVFREASLGSGGQSSIATTLNFQYSPTDLTVSYVASPSYSGSSETDIIYQQGEMPPDFIGMAWCDDAIGGDLCDQHYVRFLDANPTVALSCHETGHAVGLTHPDNADPDQPMDDPLFGCLVTPVNSAFLRIHNHQQINAAY